MTVVELEQSFRSAPGLVVVTSAGVSATVVALRGEADLATLPVVADVLARVIAENEGAVVIDLADTEFIDSATVGALSRAGQFLAERDRALVLRSPSRLAARVLAVFDLSHLVDTGAMA